MKYIILTGLLLCYCPLAQADIYAVFDKETGECKGTIDINPENISEIAKTYTMKKADESFRGKQEYEIRLENKKLRLATEEEIKNYFNEKERIAKTVKRKELLEELGITEEHLIKLKTQ